MKVGICGAHSVGKTTILNALRSCEQLSNFTFRSEVTRKVKELGLAINTDGGDLTQRQIVLEHFHNLLMYDNMITDRTLIDALVYTESLACRDPVKVSYTTVRMVRTAALRNCHLYDIIFFIEPEFTIVEDGVRSIDEEWQTEINNRFIEFFDEQNITYTKLSGNVVKRCHNALEAITSHEQYR